MRDYTVVIIDKPKDRDEPAYGYRHARGKNWQEAARDAVESYKRENAIRTNEVSALYVFQGRCIEVSGSDNHE